MKTKTKKDRGKNSIKARQRQQQQQRKGMRYAWAPFSAGMHKCAGYSLAMLEIPVILALVLREYDMDLLDPIPQMDFRSAFGVVGPDDTPVRVVSQERKRRGKGRG